MPEETITDFKTEIANLIKHIYNLTGKVFIPTQMGHSPVDPKNDIMVVMRSAKNVNNFKLEGWFTEDIDKLGQKFQIKTIKKIEQNLHARKTQFKTILSDFYKNEKLQLIGGFENSKQEVILLMFKMDTLS